MMPCSLECQRTIKINYLTTLHRAGDLKRVILAPLPENFFEDLVNGDDRHKQVIRVLNSSGKERGALAAREIFEPAG